MLGDMRRPAIVAPLALVLAVLTCACNSGGSSAPADASDAPCVLHGDTWDCPATGDSFPACPAGAGEAPSCNYDGSPCYGCIIDDLAGAVCTCGGEAGAVWSCLPAGTACSQ
jgi:hypothetical protein